MDKINQKEKLVELLDKYQNLIFSICLKMTNDYFTSEDLTQETFLSAYKSLSTFDGMDEKAWLCRIATNKCLDYCKAGARKEIASEDKEFEEQISENSLTENNYLEKEMWEQLEQECKSLSPPYDDIAVRHFVREQSTEDIAAETGRNIKTVQTQIYRARGMLRKKFRKEQFSK